MTECVIIINSHSDLTQKTAYTQHPQEQISFKVKNIESSKYVIWIDINAMFGLLLVPRTSGYQLF